MCIFLQIVGIFTRKIETNYRKALFILLQQKENKQYNRFVILFLR